MSLLTSRLISKESHQSPKGDCEVFWQFDKCTLLSSQGSDAPAFRSLDRLRRATPILFFAVACRIGAFRSESKQPDSVSRREIRCPAFWLSASRRGNFSILSLSVSLSNRLSGTVQRLR